MNEEFVLSEAILNFEKAFSFETRRNHNFEIEFEQILQRLINYLNYGISNSANKKTMIYILNTLE